VQNPNSHKSQPQDEGRLDSVVVSRMLRLLVAARPQRTQTVGSLSTCERSARFTLTSATVAAFPRRVFRTQVRNDYLNAPIGCRHYASRNSFRASHSAESSPTTSARIHENQRSFFGLSVGKPPSHQSSAAPRLRCSR